MRSAKYILLFFIFYYSCAGNTSRETETKEEKNDKITQKNNKTDPELMKRGEILYKQHCLACHQTDGSGNPGMYPPLQQTEFVLGDPDQLINVVLNGLSGPLTVKGEEYNSVMAPYNFLKDTEIADLLSYVRNSFGNEARAITAEEVAAVRNIPPQ